ncbi:DUF2953 domain-containing protein [Paenibacillus sp. UNC451MF]|uniref:DUF2953 domain-containing protein n=1 Tax=Paenibacillus sp. UNC451MF TaxID=1449063 RepID=UPI00048C7F0A|nr:DUF2953 domain-containing protein [Paenibacillus sp. UNC451MF]
MIWPWILGAVIVLLALLACSSMQCRFTIVRKRQDDEIVVDVHTMYGLVKQRIAIPVVKFLNVTEGVDYKTEIVNKANNQLEQGTKNNLTNEKIKQAIENFQLLLAHCFQFNSWFRETLHQVRCTEFYWKTNVGVGDAPETAMTAGMVWGLKSSLLGYLFRFVQLETRPVLQVIPQYNVVTFSSEVQVLAKIRVYEVMLAGCRLLGRIMKIKGGLRMWRKVLFKAS